MRRLLKVIPILLLGFTGFIPHTARGAEPGIQPIAEVLQMPLTDQTPEIPVTVAGTLICLDPDWTMYFVQDESGAIFFDYPNSSGPSPVVLQTGNRVEISGLATRGWNGTVFLAKPTLKLLDRNGAIPAPLPLSHEAFLTAPRDSQWIEVTGTARIVLHSDNHTGLLVYSDESDHWIAIWLHGTPDVQPLLDRTIQVRGICLLKGETENHFTGVELFCPGLEHIESMQATVPENSDPASAPRPVRHARIRSAREFDALPPQLVMRGIVTYVGGKRLFLTDGIEKIEVFHSSSPPLTQGDCVRVHGTPERRGNHHLVLRDTQVERLDHGQLPHPERIREQDRSRRTNHGRWIEMEGYLVNQWRDPQGSLILGLKWDDFTFTAALHPEISRESRLPIRPNSLMRIRGITSYWNEKGEMQATFSLLPGTPDHIRLLHPGSWWTPARTRGAVILLGLILTMMAWAIFFLRHRERQARELASWHRKHARLEQRLQDLVDQSSDCIFTLDVTGAITSINRAGETLSGMPIDQLYSRPFGELLSRDSTTVFSQHFRQLALSGAPIRCELQLENPTGTVHFLDVNFIPLSTSGPFQGVHGIGRDTTTRKQAESEFSRYRNKLSQLNTRLALTEEKERRRIACELHDMIGQTLSASQIKLGRLLQKLEAPEHQQMARETRTLIGDTLKATRSLVFELSPPVLNELGMRAALDWLAEKWAHDYDLTVHILSPKLPLDLEPDVRLHAFRITRELLTNVAKHARAQRVDLSCTLEDDRVVIRVRDDGCGFDVEAAYRERNTSRGYGLFSIRDTLDWISGSLRIQSAPGQGADVVFSIPVKPRPQPADRKIYGCSLIS